MARRLLVLVLSFAASALADDRFGSRGQIVPFGGISVSHISFNGGSQSFVALSPGVLWFAVDGIAFGGQAAFSYASGDTAALDNGVPITVATRTWALSLSPEVAGVVHLSDRVALFPQVSVDFAGVWSSGVVGHTRNLQAFAPVVFIPVPHLFLGFGPFVTWAFSGDSANSGTTIFGLQSQIGGWF